MGKQKRFQKQTLNSEEDKAMENGAKKLKRVLGFAAPLALAVANKDKLKAIGKGAVNLSKQVLKK